MRTLKTMNDWLVVGTDIKIESLSYYLDKLYTQLESLAEDFKARMESEAQKIEDDAEKDRFFEFYEDDYWHHTEVFPSLFLNSFHIAAYSLLETEIYNIARHIGKKQNQKFDVSEIRGGDYLESACYYIKKLTGIDAKDDSQFSCWPGLKDGQRLRNIIVHSSGKVTTASNTSLARKCGVYNASRKEVTMTIDYCKSFIKLLKTFFSEMYTEITVGNYLQ